MPRKTNNFWCKMASPTYSTPRRAHIRGAKSTQIRTTTQIRKSHISEYLRMIVSRGTCQFISMKRPSSLMMLLETAVSITVLLKMAPQNLHCFRQSSGALQSWRIKIRHFGSGLFDDLEGNDLQRSFGVHFRKKKHPPQLGIFKTISQTRLQTEEGESIQYL